MEGGQKLQEALQQWRGLSPGVRVYSGPEIPDIYTHSTLSPKSIEVSAVLLPGNADEVRKIVHIAEVYGIALYPISRGRNWGYGSATPARDGCVIIDLSRMDRVISFDRVLGLVTVEPGVTMGHLERYLQENELSFLAPVVGAGAWCSLIGNALERGTSLTANSDRFDSLIALEAVLSDGTIYRSPFAEGTKVSPYKWGVGPYLDGLFSQSNIGIVTRATFLLAPRPHASKMFVIRIREDGDLASAVESMRKLAADLGSVLAYFEIANDRLIMGRTLPYPSGKIPLSGAVVREAIGRLGFGSWTIVGSLQGELRMTDTAREVITDTFAPQECAFYSGRRLFRNQEEANLSADAKITLSILQRFFQRMNGRNGSTGGRLPFWRIGDEATHESDDSYDLNPQCGLIFFTAVSPMTQCMAQFAHKAATICENHAIEPLVNIRLCSDRTLCVNIPLLFDKSDARSCDGARACYRALAEEAKQEGLFIQRVPHQFMEEILDTSSAALHLARRLKEALDPKGIMAPGRYDAKQ